MQRGKGKQRTWKTSTMKRSATLESLRNEKIQTLRGDVMATLRSLQGNFLAQGKGNLYDAIQIPPEMLKDCTQALIDFEGYSESDAQTQGKIDALNEWVAMNTVDFYNELQLLYSLCAAFHEENYKGANQGFPPGFNYRFPGKEVLNGSEYVRAVMSWISDQLESPAVFPESDADPFPKDFLDVHMNKIYTRMCRVFAIMYTRCLKSYQDIDAVKALNYCWKHFYYFVKRFDLVKEQEYKAFELSSLKKTMKMSDMSLEFSKDKAKSGKS